MATYVGYAPATTIGRAMFNFDAFAGMSNYKYSGVVRVSVSDAFSYSDYIDPYYSAFYSQLYTYGSEEVVWTSQMIGNVQDVLAIYSQFCNISFQFAGDYDTFTSGSDYTVNPEDVGRFNLSDINITLINRFDGTFAGISGANSDALVLNYIGAAGDVFLNSAASKFAGDLTLDVNTRARQTLMHEIGHSLGLSHPHSSYNASTGQAILTADYAATVGLGFDQLGFHINSAQDMYKEYFTIMSYDDQQSLLPGSSALYHAHTPMILDVIALQQAYGEGGGTSGAGNDTIVAGNAGYRTYFDTGGIDTVDLSVWYTDGAYLNMGASIAGAAHLVGVSMSFNDGVTTILNGGDPAHLRWYYGEYENAIGSANTDLLIGNALDNVITGGGGIDSIDGQGGVDTAVYSGAHSQYQISAASDGSVTIADLRGGAPDGTDTDYDFEYFRFSDGTFTLSQLIGNPGQGHTAHDFNGDGTSDVLLQNASGWLVDWMMQNGSMSSWHSLGVQSGWKVAGTGDFNNDGTSDILLGNGSGWIVDWTMQNGSMSSWQSLGVQTGWTVVGTGDFNNDGTDDVLLQNGNGWLVNWTMQNGSMLSWQSLGVQTGWKVVGTGDFNNDNTTDVLLQNGNGWLVEWTMQNGVMSSWRSLGVQTGWDVAGTGDFNHDGTCDVLLQNSSGWIVDWTMQNGGMSSWQSLGVQTGWDVAGTGDFNNDGTCDVLLENGSGWIVDWTMQNGAMSSWHSLGVQTGWLVV